MAQGNSNDNFYIMASGIALMVAAYIFWYLFGQEITIMVRWLRVGELYILSFFTEQFEAVRKALPHMIVADNVQRLTPQHLDWPTLWNISTRVGDIMRWPTTVLLLCCVAWIIVKSPRTRFKHKYDIESLIEVQSRTWPIIKPLLKINPIKSSTRVPGDAVPRDLPQFAESLSPHEWVVWAGLPLVAGLPEKESVRQAFVRQLGPRWQGYAGLRAHHRGLLAAFALKGAQRRKECDELLGQMATCWSPEEGLVLTAELNEKISKLLADRNLMKPALEVAAQHAYRTTALLGVLEWARKQGGVLAPATFVWVRGADRALWYPLNNLGRRSFHAEASGAMAHYMAERVARRPLPVARVDTAIAPLIDYLRAHAQEYPEAKGRRKKA